MNCLTSFSRVWEPMPGSHLSRPVFPLTYWRGRGDCVLCNHAVYFPCAGNRECVCATSGKLLRKLRPCSDLHERSVGVCTLPSHCSTKCEKRARQADPRSGEHGMFLRVTIAVLSLSYLKSTSVLRWARRSRKNIFPCSCLCTSMPGRSAHEEKAPPGRQCQMVNSLWLKI